jgi:hypothetical protein
VPPKVVWGKIDGIGSSLGRGAVMTQAVPRALVKDRFGGFVPARLFPSVLLFSISASFL